MKNDNLSYIKNKNDCILIENSTETKNFTPEMTQSQLFVEAMRRELSQNDHGTFDMRLWLSMFEKNTLGNQESLETKAILLTLKEFNSTKLASYNSHQLNTLDLPLSQEKSIENLLEGYKVIRLYNTRLSDDNKKQSLDLTHFVDLKYQDITEDELFKSIMQIPLFLRDILTLTRHQENSVLASLNNWLSNYYAPFDKAVSALSEMEGIGTRTLTYDRIKNKLNNNSYCDFDNSQLATLLCFMLPGKVMPMTYHESKAVVKIDIKTCVTEKATVLCHVPNYETEDYDTVFSAIINLYQYRESQFVNTNRLDRLKTDFRIVGVPGLGGYYGLKFDHELLNCLENQRQLEIKESLD